MKFKKDYLLGIPLITMAVYKLTVHDVAKMLNNQTDLGYLLEKYTKELKNEI